MGGKTNTRVYLINESLSNSASANINTKMLDYCNNGETVGVAFDSKDDDRPYVAYRTNERGRTVVKKTFSSFEEARQKAVMMYDDLCFVMKTVDESIAKREKEKANKNVEDPASSFKITPTIIIAGEKQLYPGLSGLKIGDYVCVCAKTTNDSKTRKSHYLGTVVKMRTRGDIKTFTVRRMSYGIGIERTFPYNSDVVERIEVLRRGIRKNKLSVLKPTRKLLKKRIRLETNGTAKKPR